MEVPAEAPQAPEQDNPHDFTPFIAPDFFHYREAGTGPDFHPLLKFITTRYGRFIPSSARGRKNWLEKINKAEILPAFQNLIGTSDKKTVDDFIVNSPIFELIESLDECHEIEGYREGRSVICKLSRNQNPSIRKDAEDTIKRRCGMLPNLVYVSVGTGGLFQDFMILNKIINPNTKSISVILIDPSYRDVIESNRNKQDSLTPLQRIRKDNENPDINKFELSLRSRQKSYIKDFGKYFSRLAQQSNFSFKMYVYASNEEYLQDVREGRQQRANVMICFDAILASLNKDALDVAMLQEGLKMHGLAFILTKNYTPKCPFTICEKITPESLHVESKMYDTNNQTWEGLPAEDLSLEDFDRFYLTQERFLPDEAEASPAPAAPQ